MGSWQYCLETEQLGTHHGGGERILLDPQAHAHPEAPMSANVVPTLWLTSLVPHESHGTVWGVGSIVWRRNNSVFISLC